MMRFQYKNISMTITFYIDLKMVSSYYKIRHIQIENVLYIT